MSATSETPVPSRMMLQALKLRKKGAVQGHALLKKKSDALTSRFRSMLKDIVETKKEIGNELNEAAYSLAKAVWAGGDFRPRVIDNVKRPGVTLKIASENVAGVKLPIFTVNADPTVDFMGNITLGQGGQVMLGARDQFLRALSALIRLASLQTAFFTLDSEIKMTNRRVSALDNVVIPRLDAAQRYIQKELDEMEREEFFRLKKIQEKKKEWAEEEERAMTADEKRKRDMCSKFSVIEEVKEKDEGIIF
eukprot:GHVP01002201.1.p1 GENE.GHVP01002201.1~~GHVP01002201.1.p1  ORF type:complete len:250 (-),score=56.43 GHVP01002201.1:909-1658(-)